MTSKYPHLFSPITIRNKTFKNRILVAPMGIEERGEAGILSPRGIRYYEDIAEGGCARVCTGENDVCPCHWGRFSLTPFDKSTLQLRRHPPEHLIGSGGCFRGLYLQQDKMPPLFGAAFSL